MYFLDYCIAHARFYITVLLFCINKCPCDRTLKFKINADRTVICSCFTHGN